MIWIIFLTILGFTRGANITKGNILGELQGSWQTWSPCTDKTRCLFQRIHSCTQQPDPVQACTNGAAERTAWKEELKACDSCLGDWLPRSTWSNCQGVGCMGSYETREFSCSNSNRQPNCAKTETRYCDGTGVCDGAWASWANLFPCTKTCNVGLLARRRVCKKGNRKSGNCAGQFTSGFIDSGTVWCNTQSCNVVPTWGGWSQCDCTKASGQQQQRQCTANCPPGQPTIEYRSCAQCTTTTLAPITTTTSITTTKSTAQPATTTDAQTGTVDLQGNVGGRGMATAGSKTTTSSKVPEKRMQPTTGDSKDRIIIIVTATAVVIFLVLIICVLVGRIRKKTKPLQIQVQQQAPAPLDGNNRRTLLFEHTPDGVYEEMGLVTTRSGSCPNFNRALPATPSPGRRPPKPPRRNRPVSQISTHSFSDMQRSLSVQDCNVSAASVESSPTGSFRVTQIYSNPHSGKYLNPMN